MTHSMNEILDNDDDDGDDDEVGNSRGSFKYALIIVIFVYDGLHTLLINIPSFQLGVHDLTESVMLFWPLSENMTN